MKTSKKNQKCKKLELQQKIREPLSVRKFDKNQDVLCEGLEFSRNASCQFSTLPSQCMHSDLLADTCLTDSNIKFQNTNSATLL